LSDRSVAVLLFKRFRRNWLSAGAALIILALAFVGIFAPHIAPYDPNEQNYERIFEGPGPGHLFGTDELGRDVFSRVVHGTRISLVISVLAVGLGAVLGVMTGLLAGYYGGTLDAIVGRIIDLLLSFPGILIAMLIAAALRAGLLAVIIAVAVYSVPTFARLARGAALSVRSTEYVEAARAAGAGDYRMLTKHVLLNSFGPILVYATLLLGSAILTAAALSFLGVGVPPPAPEWGAMINQGRAQMRHAPHVVMFPGLAIFLTVLSFNLLGDALRDVLDPRNLT